MDNPLEQYVFNRAAETLVAWAIKENDAARKRREGAVADWLLNAEVEVRGFGRPEPPQPPPPAKLIKITVPEGTSDQSRLLVEFGPELVADAGPVVLPAIPVPNYPPNVIALGHDYGSIVTALDNDTMPNKSKVSYTRKNGEEVILIKHFIPWHEAGALFAKVNFYEVVQ